MALHYDPASSSYTSNVPPGTAAFRKVVGGHYGLRTEVIRDHSRCQQTRSEHCECRAIDFFVAAPGGRPLFDWAVAHAEKLGIQSVIHNRRVWGFGTWSERDYHGPSPHTDHVHIGLTIDAAHRLTEQQVNAEFGEGDWFDMATEADLRKVVQEELAKLIGHVYYDGGTVLAILTEKKGDKYIDGVKAIREDIAALPHG